MKLLITFFILVIALPLYAQKPVVKFYLNDGKTSQSKIEDISEINFIKSNLSYSIEIFKYGSINTYNVKDINSIEFIDSTKLTINLSNSSENISITDIDSIIFVPNTCTEIVIGTQTWMCKNLDVDHYRNGDEIPQVTDSTAWVNLTTGAWCYYNNDPANGAIYGKLYNWYAVIDPRGLAPDGWHVPSDDEWTTMTNYLGDESAGGKLKSTGTIEAEDGLWYKPNFGATNETGFSALPGGCRSYEDGTFIYIGAFGYWWSSSEGNITVAWSRNLTFIDPYLFRATSFKRNGFSVRCVKD